MRASNASVLIRLVLMIGVVVFLAACSAPASNSNTTPASNLEKGGQEEFGPYEIVENWLQPLPDSPDGVKHEGWTWGSVGAIFAETPDRIWIAQRGELPLPKGAKPWTPYGMLTPERTATGNDDGLDATLREPVRELMEIGREGAEAADSLRNAICPDRSHVHGRPDVDGSRVRVDRRHCALELGLRLLVAHSHPPQ